MAKKARPRHILALRFSALGDVAMMVPVLLAVTKKYPELRITVVSRDFKKALFEGMEGVGFYEAKLKERHHGFFGLWKLYKELRHLDFDAVADLHNVLRSNILRAFFTLGGFKVVQIDKGRRQKKALTQPQNKSFHQLMTTHERYAAVFSQLGYPIELKRNHILKRIVRSQRLQELTGNQPKKWIGIAPFAAHQGKMYDLGKMGNVISKLKNTKEYKIFLFGGGAKEQKQLEAFASELEDVFNMVGRLTFAEELQLISNLDLMVSMDSANGHLAANYGIPVITLWGVTHPFAGFAPFGQPEEHWILSDRSKYPLIPTSIYGNRVPEGYENVMDSIEEDVVFSKIESILA